MAFERADSSVHDDREVPLFMHMVSSYSCLRCGAVGLSTDVVVARVSLRYEDLYVHLAVKLRNSGKQ